MQAFDPASPVVWADRVPDVGAACEVLLADRLLHDLTSTEREGLLEFVRSSQGEDGAWLDDTGQPDLSLTVLGWWARRQAGDDARSPSMVLAQRTVHALGGAQRASFGVRLWLAMAGQIPWSYLPAIPGELFLLPEPMWLSPSRTSPWARGMLTPYYLIAAAPARLHLADASPLLLERRPETLVAPRLTRPGLAGDLLQALDRTVRLSRKLPRGGLPRWAQRKAEQALHSTQQDHGGWFSTRPTLLSVIALRVLGERSDAPRVQRGLAYLRKARAYALLPSGPDRGRKVLVQRDSTALLSTTARIIAAAPSEDTLGWLLTQEVDRPGPWQDRADAPVGGWPREVGGVAHLDMVSTCAALDAIRTLEASSGLAGQAWGATRRAMDVLVAMQEASGGFARYERGEAAVFMRRFPWSDADLLAFGEPDDLEHVRVTAAALAELGRTGFRIEDDRVDRGVRWLAARTADERGRHDITTLAVLADAYAATCPEGHEHIRRVERQLRARQCEDGSFGGLLQTAHAVRGLLALGERCVQTTRAVRHLVGAVQLDPSRLHHASDAEPSAAACEVTRALAAFRAAGGTL